MGETVITTIEQLAAAYPDLTAAVREQGVKSVNLEAAIREAAGKATTAEKDRILGLAGVHFGTEEGAKFAGIVNTGVTVEQLTAIRGSERSAQAQSAEDKKREELLAGIKGAGASGVGADAGGAATETKDYMTLVNEHRAQHKCSMTEAMSAVTAKYPEKHREYIKAANQGK